MKSCKITRLCDLSGITPQAFYKGRTARKRKAINVEVILGLVRQVRANHPRMGARKVLQMIRPQLKEAGISVGRDRFIGILSDHGMLIEPRRRGVRTTYSNHSLPLYRNLLYQLEPTAPHQVWVADITYIDTEEGFMYLSMITDRFSRKIVGWNLGETIEAAESVKALAMAIKDTPSDRWPIHHSDRGSQYCCREYTKALKARDLSISMTEANHCYENSCAERVNGILKDEYYMNLCFKTKDQAREVVAQTIHLYNHYRPHLSLNMQVPAQVHQPAA